MERTERVTAWVVGLVSAVVLGAVAMVLFGVKARAGAGAGDSILPELNASLNATSAVFLTMGYVFVRRRRIAAHKTCMIGALAASGAFLVGYLIHHSQAGSVKFQGEGLLRQIYFGILIPHSVLAAVMVPFVLFTVVRAFRGDFQRHKKVARWTLPMWLLVSVSGVAVYFLLYHFGQ